MLMLWRKVYGLTKRCTFCLKTNNYQVLTVVSSSMFDLGCSFDHEMDSDELNWTLAYRRVLLEANADPTLEPSNARDLPDCHFTMALATGTVVGMFFRSGQS